MSNPEFNRMYTLAKELVGEEKTLKTSTSNCEIIILKKKRIMINDNLISAPTVEDLK